MATIIRYAIQTIILAAVHCWTGAVFFVRASVCVAAEVWSYYMMIARAATRTLMNGHFVRSWGRDGVLYLYTLFHPSFSYTCYHYYLLSMVTFVN